MSWLWDNITIGDLRWAGDMLAFKNYCEDQAMKRAQEKAKRESKNG